MRINYHYCAIYNKGRRVTTQKEECKRTNNERQIRIIFLIDIATHKLLVNKISSSKGKQLCFYHASCSFTMINHYHNINGRFKGKVQSQTLLVTKQCPYVGVYMRPHVYTNICLKKETLHNFYLPQRANSLMENNCQNSPQVSTHNIVKSKHASWLIVSWNTNDTYIT